MGVIQRVFNVGLGLGCFEGAGEVTFYPEGSID